MRKPLIFAVLITLIVLVFYSSDLSSYGPTWDEFFHRPTGKIYLDFLKTGKMEQIFTFSLASWLPPVASTVGYYFMDNAQFVKIFPFPADRFHFGAVLFGSITVGFVFLITYELINNLWVSLFSSVLLSVLPQFVTQSHTNVRDMGLTMFYTASVYILLKTVTGKKNIVWLFLLGVLTGITTDAKHNGAFLIFISFIVFFRQRKKWGIKATIYASIFYFITVSGTFFLFWPYLWANTINHLQLVWYYLRSESILGGNLTFYDKLYYSMHNIPIYYPWVMLFITTPPIVGLLAIFGFIKSFKAIFSTRKKLAIIFLWIFIPLLRFFYPPSSIAHDQIRHFLEVLPTLAVFTGIGIYYLFIYAKSQIWPTLGVIFLALISLVYTGYITVIYRPFGTAYFNIFAGSSDYVTHAFDVEYWGNVYRYAAGYLNRTYGSSVIYYTPGLGTHLLEEDGLQGKITENLSDSFDYVIFMNKQNWIRMGNRPYIEWLLKYKKPEYTVERQGVILFYMFKPYIEEYRKTI